MFYGDQLDNFGEEVKERVLAELMRRGESADDFYSIGHDTKRIGQPVRVVIKPRGGEKREYLFLREERMMLGDRVQEALAQAYL
ncbi:MAG TPA: hypothetical protein VLC46_26800 [Thermoanaerobaculia bacterium]|jgi:hypothetical protein|nr:hypothetical protein [Thermoanaerobaculia bacterium]